MESEVQVKPNRKAVENAYMIRTSDIVSQLRILHDGNRLDHSAPQTVPVMVVEECTRGQSVGGKTLSEVVR